LLHFFSFFSAIGRLNMDSLHYIQYNVTGGEAPVEFKAELPWPTLSVRTLKIGCLLLAANGGPVILDNIRDIFCPESLHTIITSASHARHVPSINDLVGYASDGLQTLDLDIQTTIISAELRNAWPKDALRLCKSLRNLTIRMDFVVSPASPATVHIHNQLWSGMVDFLSAAYPHTLTHVTLYMKFSHFFEEAHYDAVKTLLSTLEWGHVSFVFRRFTNLKVVTAYIQHQFCWPNPDPHVEIDAEEREAQRAIVRQGMPELWGSGILVFQD